MASLTSQADVAVDAWARVRSDSGEVLSLDGIGGNGLASRLATTAHYKNLGLALGRFAAIMNPLGLFFGCENTDLLLQKMLQKA
ncbi:MAG: hypothetical protein ACOYB1_16905 [Limnohabitans sp.]